MTGEPAAEPLKVFWQPGCTSCLRTKEFLQKRGVPFISVNVLAEQGALAELARFGVRTVPIVSRGEDWANGQVLEDVARVAGIDFGGRTILPAAELMRRLNLVQSSAQRFLTQIPEARLGTMLPNRPRSYAQLAYHIFNIADALLEHEVAGLALQEGAYSRVPPPAMKGKAELLAYGRDVQRRLNAWWEASGRTADLERKPASVYFGSNQSVLDFLERTTWHSGQHVRQLALVLGALGIEPDQPLGPETWVGLPMPEKVWDDEPDAAFTPA